MSLSLISYTGIMELSEMNAFFYDCFVDIFVSNSLYSVRNGLDSWIIV